eukprot:m.176181 g.176181  ORF g.176181 m.176181 type:complete len:368 (-) comp14121_c0_seq1:171-1274(-)
MGMSSRVVCLVAAACSLSTGVFSRSTSANHGHTNTVSAPPPPPAPPIVCDSLPAQPCISLWPNGSPNETAGQFPPETRTPNDGQGCGPMRNIPCDHINSVSHPTLTPFLVTNGTGAAIVIAPGGGYHDLSWGKEGLDVARFYNSIGVSAFVLKYRVPARPDVNGLPHWWAPLQDAQRAMGLVRSQADKFGLNASQIGFTGFSAGGHLTAHISTAYETRAYAPVDAADSVSCKPDFSIFMYPWMLLPNNKPAPWGQNYSLSPDFAGQVDANHPISLFVQNLDDGTAPPQGTLTYASDLLAVKAPTPTIHLYNKGGHGFGMCQTFPTYLEVCDWPKAAQRFLQDHGFAMGWPQGHPEPEQMLEQNCPAV